MKTVEWLKNHKLFSKKELPPKNKARKEKRRSYLSSCPEWILQKQKKKINFFYPLLGKTKTHAKLEPWKQKGQKQRQTGVDIRTVPEIPGPIAWLNQQKETKTWKQSLQAEILKRFTWRISRSERVKKKKKKSDWKFEKKEKEKIKDPPLGIK